MATEREEKEKKVQHKDRYEREDARFSAVIAAGLILFTAAVMVALGMWYFMRYSDATLEREDKPISPLAKDDQKPAPPAPRLQFSPKQDMDLMRAREKEYLSSYGWVSKEAGVVHMPIERAMDITLKLGLPSADAPTTAVDHATSRIIDSSSGRAYERITP